MQKQNTCYQIDIQINEGLEKCKSHFSDLVNESKEKALKYLNDTRLTFPALYINMPLIKEGNLTEKLKDEYTKAVIFADQVLNKTKTIMQGNLTDFTVLKWIFETGYNVNINSLYNEILDITVSKLINIYKDITILPKVAHLIFLRNRENANIHELVWSYFRTNTVHTLRIVSNKLISTNEKDVKLANLLLNTNGRGKVEYTRYIEWLNENEPYIYFTGESYQYSSTPEIYKVNKGYKYLCKKKLNEALSSNDKRLLEAFESLSEENQNALSSYSHKLFRIDNQAWVEFMKLNTNSQLSVCISKGA